MLHSIVKESSTRNVSVIDPVTMKNMDFSHINIVVSHREAISL